MQRVVQRPQIRRDLLVKVAGQKPERFAGFNRGSRQNNSRDFLFLERLHGHRHRQISFARARGANAEKSRHDRESSRCTLLPDGLRRDRGFARRSLDALLAQSLERFGAVMPGHIQRIGELAIPHGRAPDGPSRYWNTCLARSMSACSPSSLIQPSREVAFTESSSSSSLRFLDRY